MERLTLSDRGTHRPAWWVRTPTAGEVVLWVALTSAVSALLTPPFQSPDERHHVARAHLLSHGQLLLTRSEELGSGGPADTGLLDFMQTHDYFDRKKEVAVDPARRDAAARITFTGETTYYPIPGTGYYLPIMYVPQAFALGVGERLGATVAGAYAGARWCAWAATLVVLFWALSLLRANPLTIAIITSPLFLFQVGAATIDGLSTAGSMAYLALCVRAWREGRSLTAREVAVAVASMVVSGGARPHLFPFALLPVVLGPRASERRGLTAAALSLTLLALWCGYALSTTVDVRVKLGIPTASIVHYYLVHPGELGVVLLRSLGPDPLFSYVRSFTGLLGWGEYRVENFVYVASYIGFPVMAWSSYRRAEDARARARRRIAVGLAASCALLVLLIMLVTWTPHPATLVRGVAGRYFWVPAIFASAMLDEPVPSSPTDEARGRWGALAVRAWAVLSFVGLVRALVERYHV